jgi:hypothetical protein
MWLEYHFKDIMCEVEIESRGEEPNLTKKLCEVDYDYEVSISEEDIIECLSPRNFNKLSLDFQVGFKTGIRLVIAEDLINFDDLEDNEDFIKFMTEKYQEKAHEKCVDENA